MTTQVAPGVYLLDIAWPEPVGSNAYLIEDGTLTLVDTGLPFPRRSMQTELSELGYSLTDIDRILLTHYDIDHVGGLSRLSIDVPVYLGIADVELVQRDWSPSWRHHKGAFHRVVRRLFSLSSVNLQPLEDGDEIGNYRAIHTPGHNPGHMVYLNPSVDACLLGDLVWENAGAFVPPSWIDSYDVELLQESITRVATESFHHGCVAHGKPISPGGDAALAELAHSL